MDKFANLRPNVGVTVFPVTFKEPESKVMVLTYRRPEDAETFPGAIAFPNGFMNIEKHSTLEDAAIDALKEKTGVELSHFECFNSFSGSHIDPRRVTVNVGFISMHNSSEISFDVSEHIGEPEWRDIDELLSLKSTEFAFNHYEVLESAKGRLEQIAQRTSYHAKMLESEFTITSFKKLTEILTDTKLDRKTFVARLNKYNVVEKVGVFKVTGTYGAPRTYFRIEPDHDGTFVAN